MDAVYLKQRFDSNNLKGNPADDSNAPYTIVEWKNRMALLNEKDFIYYYNQYIIDWFYKNKNKPVSQSFVLKQKYIYLLDQLQLFFTEEEKQTWYSQILLQDERELLTSIPHFARRLRDITLYYLSLRKKIQSSKRKFSSLGTAANLEQQIYNHFLETFSTDSAEITPELGLNLPALSSLQEKFAVNVEELYDDKQYFDLSPTKSLSSYFDLTHQATAEFFNTKGLVLSSADWLFNSFNIAADGNFNTFISNLTGRVFETTDVELYNSFIQKYVGQVKNTVQFTQSNAGINTYEINLNTGNNFFYYPYGTNSTTFNTERQIENTTLSSIDFTTFVQGDRAPTAGDNLQNSDVIYVRYGREMKGAWLRYQPYYDTNQNIKVSIKKDVRTSFVFPFPGYGLSSTDFTWTGFGFETTPEYDFMPREMKAAVNEIYSAAPLPSDTCISIPLNNTTFSVNGANAGIYPYDSDQVFIRANRQTDTTSPLGSPNGAWLYKFLKTSIAISPNEDNVFIWPYGLIDQQEDPGIYTKLDYEDVCTSIGVNDLPRRGFLAGTTFETADKIYKYNAFDGTDQDALECAWLSGVEINADKYAYVQQDSFSVLFADEVVKFVWTGPNAKLSEVFAQIQHKDDCPFSTNSELNEADWEQCDCKQVYHSPFGHPYDRFETGQNFADCIAKVPRQDLETFDFSSWLDLSGKNVFNSTNSFAWFKTNSKFGWGDGKWVRNGSDSEPFQLETGKCYFFKRAANRLRPGVGMPPYIVNYSYNTNKTKWILAKKDAAGDWSQFYDLSSTMKIYPGDILKIERQQSFPSYILSAYEVRNEGYNSANSLWSDVDSLPYFCGEEKSATFSWPIIDDPRELVVNSQSPGISYEQIQSIYGWSVTRLEGTNAEWPTETYTILDKPTLTFTPPTTGTFCISVTANLFTPSLSTIVSTPQTSAADLQRALDADLDQAVEVVENDTGTVSIIFTPKNNDSPSRIVLDSTTIPCLSVFAPYSIEYNKFVFRTPTGGFILEKDLNGWNYAIGKFDNISEGAKPYWAYLDVERDLNTRYKGVYSWGYLNEYIDGYLPNNNPIISPLILEYGNLIDYQRNGFSFTWQQPIVYKYYINQTQWCILSADYSQYSNLSGLYYSKRKFDPIVYPTTQPTDIILSNYVEGFPLEVYYNALRPFTWSVSSVLPVLKKDIVAPTTTNYFVAEKPWETMQNRFFPTIANTPSLEETYKIEDVGGYFLPQYLGASLFINKEYDVTLKPQISSGLYIAEDTSRHVGGRGRSGQDQPTIYDWKENNQWLKEGETTGDLAGAVKRNLTKTLQTFIPYQSNDENTALGILNPQSRVSPWGGYQDSEWTDLENEPKSYTGIRNVAAWGETQVLKEVQKTVDNWATDIYGNQYGVYKDLTQASVADRKSTGGELWVRTNSQKVVPGYVALSEIFESFNLSADNYFKDFGTAYKELTGDGIRELECYFDTLFIRVSNLAIFAKINYNYVTKTINSTFDNIQYKLLNSNYRFEKNWFFSQDKRVVSLYTKLSSITKNNKNYLSFTPELWSLDLNERSYQKIYPAGVASLLEIQDTTQNIILKELKDCSFSYSKARNSFLITYTGVDEFDELFVSDFTILYQDELILSEANIYTNMYNVVADTQSLQIDEAPIVLPSLYSKVYSITANNTFSVSISALNNPSKITVLYPYNIKGIYGMPVSGSISNETNITFTGKLSSGIHHVNYVLNNKVGDTTYCLTLTAL